MEDVDINLLFWNLGRKNNPELIRDCIEYTNADIALFAEWGQLDSAALSTILPDDYRILPTMCDDAKILAVIKNSIEIIHLQEQTRYIVYTLSVNGKQYVLAGIHLQDKHSHPHDAARRATAQELLADVRQERANLSGAEAILIGDFNVEHTMKSCKHPTYLMPCILKRLYLASSIVLGNATGMNICITQCSAIIPKMARNMVPFTAPI